MLKQAMKIRKLKFYVLFTFIGAIQLSQCQIGPGKGRDKGTNSDGPLFLIGKNPGRPNVLNDTDGENDSNSKGSSPGKCWISLNLKSYVQAMEQLDEQYKDAREAYKQEVDTDGFDKRMLNTIQRTRGIAERALQNFAGNPNVIPAGLNLGSHSMLRMPGSLLFFYRLKLRNNTRFVVNYIHNDVDHLTLTLRLSLNDLHLVGEYERALTAPDDPSQLYYRPNKGGIEFLLKDVKYKVEGRYRLLDDRLHIEHVISEIPPMKLLMRYTGDPEEKSSPLEPANIEDYLQIMKNDLDLWLKDYFNDFLMIYGFEEAKKNPEIQEYHNAQTIQMNQYSDLAIDILNRRLKKLGAATLLMPDFTLTAANGMQIKLYDGAVRGMDTMFRRSVTTGKRVDRVSYVDTDIGFSGLKVEYRYDTYVRTGLPPLSGVLVLDSDDTSAHMSLQVVKDWPDYADLLISFLKFGKPETLTVEGPANRIIANFKHLLEHHIISIMSSTLIHHIRSLSSLVKCEPNLPGKDVPRSTDSAEQNNNEREPTQSKSQPPNDDDEPIEPTELPQNNDDDEAIEPSELPQNSDGDEPIEPSELPQNNDEDEPIKPNDSDKKKLTLSKENEPPQYNGADKDKQTEQEQSNDDDDKPSLDPDYAVVVAESIELELPPKPGSKNEQGIKINHNETFTLTKLNKDSDGNLLTKPQYNEADEDGLPEPEQSNDDGEKPSLEPDSGVDKLTLSGQTKPPQYNVDDEDELTEPEQSNDDGEKPSLEPDSGVNVLSLSGQTKPPQYNDDDEDGLTELKQNNDDDDEKPSLEPDSGVNVLNLSGQTKPPQYNDHDEDTLTELKQNNDDDDDEKPSQDPALN